MAILHIKIKYLSVYQIIPVILSSIYLTLVPLIQIYSLHQIIKKSKAQRIYVSARFIKLSLTSLLLSGLDSCIQIIQYLLYSLGLFVWIDGGEIKLFYFFFMVPLLLNLVFLYFILKILKIEAPFRQLWVKPKL